jgi:ribosomal-protein-alanine N-acetyltransferase
MGAPLEVVLRPLTPADVDALDTMEQDLFGVAAWSRASLAEEIVGPGRFYVGATRLDDDVLIGYAGLWFDGEDSQVMTVAVAGGFQGHGVGRRLMTALVAHAIDVGAARVLLEVRVDNDPALHLYESLGFRRLGRRRGYYQPGDVDAWTMTLTLAEPPYTPREDR